MTGNVCQIRVILTIMWPASHQRNFGGQPVTNQFLDGTMSAVLPSEYASRPLVLTPPTEEDLQCTSGGLYTETLQCLRSPTWVCGCLLIVTVRKRGNAGRLGANTEVGS
jgi:hypothetical protein